MQSAAAATMPTTMPVVLLLSRTTSDGPGNSFPSDTGGRAAERRVGGGVLQLLSLLLTRTGEGAHMHHHGDGLDEGLDDLFLHI